jgi:serine/threonine protein kinase
LNKASQTIGKYIVEQELGHSSLGPLYLAYDPMLDRRVAIRLYAGIEHDEARQEQLFRRVRAIAKLDHPNIVRTLDLDVHNRCPYMVAEFIEGKDLQAIIGKNLFLPFAQKLQLIVQTCQGLHHAHGKGIVHGHITPNSIRIDSEGQPKILDLGFTPEQNSDRELACRTDIFSVGALLYELVAYVRPFNTSDDRKSDSEVSGSYQPLQSVLPACALEFCEILDRALGNDRDRGFSTCAEFVDALQSFMTASASHATALCNEVSRLETDLDNYTKSLVKLNIVELSDSRSAGSIGPANDTHSADLPSDYVELLHRHTQIQQKLQLLSERLKGSLPTVQLLHTSYGQFKHGEFDNCEQTLQEVLKVSPQHSLAERLLQACRNAIAEAEQRKQYEKRLKRALTQARAAADREEFSRATLILDRILAIEPSQPEANLLRDEVNRLKLSKHS